MKTITLVELKEIKDNERMIRRSLNHAKARQLVNYNPNAGLRPNEFLEGQIKLLTAKLNILRTHGHLVN